MATQEEPGFFSKLFGGDKDKASSLQRFRVMVKAAGAKTMVSVQNSTGVADNGDAAQAIVKRLVEELK